MKIIIGIDDTDNRYSRGTGFRARELARLLKEHNLAVPLNIARHQLLVDKRIPYTSHNSSASMVCETINNFEEIASFASRYLKKNSAWFSDAGLCIIPWENTGNDIVHWGELAKKEVLKMYMAQRIADNNQIFLEGLRGRKTGIIGALAAAGLRRKGNDGRILWMENLRTTTGIFRVKELYELLKVDEIADLNGHIIDNNELINISDWCRPVLRNEKIVIFAEEVKSNEQYNWQNVSKDYIKSITN